MTRTNQIHKKGTKRPREEADNSAAFQEENLTAPSHASSHIWLRFHDKTHKKRLSWLTSLRMVTPGVIHHPSLDKYGIGDEVRGMLTPRPLTRLLNVSKPSYWELTYEFLSTFVLHFDKSPYYKPGAITFHLGGIQRSLSIQQWAIMTGLYEPEDTREADFRKAIYKWPHSVTQHEAFWASIGNGEYAPSTQKESRIREPVIRLLHKYIARSMSPRKNSLEMVTTRDLFFLHCIITNTPCHVAICLARIFDKYSRKKSLPGGLFGGAIITQVAEKFGVCLEGLSEEKKVVEWDEEWMFRNEILEPVEDGGGLRLKVGGGPTAKRVAGQSSTSATEPSDGLGREILQEIKATQATVTALEASVRELQSSVQDMARVMGLVASRADIPALLSQSSPGIIAPPADAAPSGPPMSSDPSTLGV